MLKNARLDYDKWKTWYERLHPHGNHVDYCETVLVNEDRLWDINNVVCVLVKFSATCFDAYIPLEFLSIE